MPEPAGIVSTAEEFRGRPCLRLTFGADDSLLVAHHGAHLLSWTAGGRERLYLSPKALFDGHSAIRGGVPVCFPQFNDRGALPKHGFARNLRWSPEPAARDAATGDVRLSLRLASDASTLALWPHAFELAIEFLLGPGRLQIGLSARNTGSEAWSFTGALHSYLRVEALDGVCLEGLDGQPCWDSLTNTRSRYTGAVRFAGEFDRVFAAAPGSLLLRDGGTEVQISQSPSFANTVVWNPGAAKGAALVDMPPDGFAQMVCVEAAQVDPATSVAPGQHWAGWQRLAVA